MTDLAQGRRSAFVQSGRRTMNAGQDALAELMRAAIGGDRAGYERLLRALLPTLRAYASRAVGRMGGCVEIEEVVQETLIAIHLKRHTWNPVEPFGPWLRAIVRHKVVDALRQRGRRVHVAVEDVADSLAAEQPDPLCNRAAIEKRLAALAPRQRDVVRQLVLHGRSTRDVAQRLAMTEGAVRNAIHRAIGSLSCPDEKAA